LPIHPVVILEILKHIQEKGEITKEEVSKKYYAYSSLNSQCSITSLSNDQKLKYMDQCLKHVYDSVQSSSVVKPSDMQQKLSQEEIQTTSRTDLTESLNKKKANLENSKRILRNELQFRSREGSITNRGFQTHRNNNSIMGMNMGSLESTFNPRMSLPQLYSSSLIKNMNEQPFATERPSNKINVSD
jgi:sugar-specific transcriptional regulator TrmB